MIKRILILVLSTLLSGAGSWLFTTNKSKNAILSLENKIDSLKIILIEENLNLLVARDTISALKDKISNLKQADSSNRFFISGKEKVLIEQRNIIRTQDKELLYLRRWKADAEADGIITPDTVKIKKRFFRKGYKVIR